MHLTKQIFAMN